MPFRDRLVPYKSNLLHEFGELLLYGSHQFLFLRGNLERGLVEQNYSLLSKVSSRAPTGTH